MNWIYSCITVRTNILTFLYLILFTHWQQPEFSFLCRIMKMIHIQPNFWHWISVCHEGNFCRWVTHLCYWVLSLHAKHLNMTQCIASSSRECAGMGNWKEQVIAKATALKGSVIHYWDMSFMMMKHDRWLEKKKPEIFSIVLFITDTWNYMFSVMLCVVEI